MRSAVLLACVSAAALASAATAAPYSGFYVGGSVGYDWGDANQTRFANPPTGPLNLTQGDASLDGWSAGLFAGRNWTAGSMVIGIEGSVDFGSAGGDDGGSGGDTNEWEQNWEGSLRGRLGFLISSKAMIYGTVGYSWADYDANVLNAPVSSRSHSFGGWTYGVGLELAVGADWTARLQYRHNEYDADRVSFVPPENYEIEAGPSMDSVTLGAAFHF